MLRAAVNNF